MEKKGNYREMKLFSHSMKLWGRVVEGSLRRDVMISEQEYCFMLGKSSIDAMFALKVVM